MPTSPRNDKHLLGHGQLTPPLIATIIARQYFLAAIEDQVGSVIADLRDEIYPEYCLRDGQRVPPLCEWAEKHGLSDTSGQPIDWVRSCAEHTLYQWALNEQRPWANRVPGRPTLTAEEYRWARCNDLPAFETWLTRDSDAYPLIAELGELPDSTSYDFLVILADHTLAAMDDRGYRPIELDLSRFNSLLRMTFGPFHFDPTKETEVIARRRIKDEFDLELEGFLPFATSTFKDWQGYVETSRKKDADHFAWAALHIAGGETLAEVSVSFGRDSDTVATGVNEVRKLIGMARPVGRPRGIRETHPRQERDS
jgi:hypothetical protein